MQTYFTTEAAVPMRREAAESAEMVSQLLFGDLAFLLEEGGNWIRVRHDYDGYEGWVSRNMVTPLLPGEAEALRSWTFVQAPFFWVMGPEGQLRLPMGARLPASETFVAGGDEWRLPWSPGTTARPNEIPFLARAFHNTPYLWGGRSGFGIDCSGLAQTVYRMAGIFLPRDSGEQQKAGTQVPYSDRQAGDLAFFSKPGKGRVSHVGIVDEKGGVIHASGKVRVDPLGEKGLLQADSGELTHDLISINRYQKT